MILNDILKQNPRFKAQAQQRESSGAEEAIVSTTGETTAKTQEEEGQSWDTK